MSNEGYVYSQPWASEPVECNRIETGMSLRDYFAGQALVGIMSNEYPEGMAKTLANTSSLTKAAYAVADAMLKEREK